MPYRLISHFGGHEERQRLVLEIAPSVEWWWIHKGRNFRHHRCHYCPVGCQPRWYCRSSHSAQCPCHSFQRRISSLCPFGLKIQKLLHLHSCPILCSVCR